MSEQVCKGGWAERNIRAACGENTEAPTTKAAAKVNVCHRGEKDFSVDAAEGASEIDLCADVVARTEVRG